MLFFSPYPQRGDTVRLTSDVPRGLFASPVPSGSVGVVTAVSGGRVEIEIEIDGGLAGTTVVSARGRECRVIDRGTGIERFRNRRKMRNAIRLGALILLALPPVQFAWEWWLAVGSFDGLIEYLPIAGLQSAADFALLAFADPIRAALMLLLGTATWWLAFGPKRRP